MPGFTLIELLITLTIISITLTLAIPNEKYFIQTTSQSTASNQILKAISLARSEAILRGSTITFCKSKNKKTCSGAWQDGQIILTADNQVLAMFDPLKNATLNWRSSLNREEIQFLASGETNTENGTFWYCPRNNSNPAWAIRISQTARARIEYPDQNGKINNLSCH